MDNSRLLAILNRALDHSELDLSAPPDASRPEVVAAWARFLRRSVESGVSISDPRWQRLELRAAGGRPRLFLSTDPDVKSAGATDFTLGLSLLMSLLDRDPADS